MHCVIKLVILSILLSLSHDMEIARQMEWWRSSTVIVGDQVRLPCYVDGSPCPSVIVL